MVLLTLVFWCITYFFTQSYRQFVHLNEKVANLTVRTKLMEQQRAELQAKKRVLSRVSGYLAKVKTLGLQKDDWTVFEVNVEAPVTFGTMEQILNQCANSASYYFKPVSLRIKTALAQDKGPTGQTEPALTSLSNEGDQTDGLLMIKGAFIARDQ
jgi:hypothetical protein